MRAPSVFFLALLAAAASGPTLAQPADPSPHSDAALVADVASVAPGDAFDLALRLDVEPGWHTYWTNPGDSGSPVTVDWRLPPAVVAGPLRFPAPTFYEWSGLISFVHEEAAHFLTRVSVPDDFDGDALRVEGTAEWLVCADVCLPAEQEVSLTIPVGRTERTGALDAARAALPVQAEGWTAAAAPEEGGYALTLDPPAEWGGSLDGARFFPAERGVLDHAAEQAFTREGDVWVVGLAASRYADGPADRVHGVLVAPEGGTFAGGARAVEVDALVGGPPVASASGPLSLWTALLLALGGGALLNLMPCVFPILSIKILGFVNGRDDAPATLRRHGLLFGAGVVLSFLALAAALLALRAAGAGLGWGFQLQSPPVVAALAVVMTAVALNLFGVFEVGGGLAAAGARLDRGEGPGGAFLSGVLATVVATPCTAPLMGPALGYAVVQPAGVALAVFAALGVGMALPYVVLSFRPGWLQKLPRPGPWMVTLRQALAFPLLATAAWLVWVFGQQTGSSGTLFLLLALVLVGLAAWAWGRAEPRTSATSRRLAWAVALASVVGAVALVASASGAAPAVADAQAATADGWEPYSAGAVEAYRAEGRPVFIDFTAAWCLTCQVNKKTALSTEAVQSAFAARDVAAVRADWTNRDPEITAALDRFGRAGVPLYVFYPAGGADPVVLPEVLSAQTVLDALGGDLAAGG
jgi:thiol:disulfide interchange protein DsbD